MDFMQKFLSSEIFSQEFYDEIFKFITSVDISYGDFEGNSYLIKKKDQLNFIICREDEFQDGHFEISRAISINRYKLIKKINVFACGKNIKIMEDLVFLK